MSDSNFENITPAEITITSSDASQNASVDSGTSPELGQKEAQQFEHQLQKNKKILIGIFGLLLILVAGVIFVLPAYISPADISSVAPAVVPEPASALVINQISPFQEAQMLKQREDSQNVLAAFLESQEKLEDQSVALWAEAELAEAITMAQAGDQAYREQNFIQAQDFYQQGLDILNEIEGSIPEVLATFLNQGSAAILVGQAERAESAYNIALAIAPDSQDAQLGVDRSLVLAEVLSLLESGKVLHENNQFEAARELYAQALSVDSYHAGASSSIINVDQDILDRDFNEQMSEGYAALQMGNPEQSQVSFNKALQLKPESNEAITALEQAADQITFTAINLRLKQALEYIEAEQWQLAVVEYDAALEIDENLVAAIDGRNRSRSRSNLDAFLEATIQNPLRLGEEAVYQQVSGVFNDARAIADTGPRLSSQLQQIQTYLTAATQPVNVSFISNGLTDVTIFRVGSLGLFSNETLSLTPGTYAAVGIRPGYRDVREEFVVDFTGQAPIITVQCDEEI